MAKITFSAGFRLKLTTAALIWAKYSGHRRYSHESESLFILYKFGVIFIKSLLGVPKRIRCIPAERNTPINNAYWLF